MAAGKQDTAQALSIFEALYVEGKDLGALFDELSALCRDLLVLKAAPKSGVSMLSGIADESQAAELEKLFAPPRARWAKTQTRGSQRSSA